MLAVILHALLQHVVASHAHVLLDVLLLLHIASHATLITAAVINLAKSSGEFSATLLFCSF